MCSRRLGPGGYNTTTKCLKDLAPHPERSSGSVVANFRNVDLGDFTMGIGQIMTNRDRSMEVPSRRGPGGGIIIRDHNIASGNDLDMFRSSQNLCK